jgi:hypothetical protein
MNGFSGPIPKREEERRRVNKTTESGMPTEVQRFVVYHDDLQDTSLVKAPSAPESWHWLPRMQYEAARRSAIREFYEPTDWAQLFLLCETLDSHLRTREVWDASANEGEGGFVTVEPEPIPGATLSAILKGFTGLMFDEGGRRRLRLEIQREAGSAAALAAAAGAGPTGDNVIDIREARLA